ncbi:MAG: molybdate ABC transporter substrate-binding protein [Candidatus Binatia bacterium]
MPAEIIILSAGAVKPGLTQVIDAFRRESNYEVRVSFATAPAILKKIGGGESVDILIAPPAVLDELGKLEKVAAESRAALGRIGIGVFVRDGAQLPQIATVDEFNQALLGAESVVYNQASTGTYLEALFDRLGIGAALQAKATRYPDFGAVLQHVSQGKGREIGFGATTVIIENRDKGVQFAGPLPVEIQNYTAYAAAVIAQGDAKKAAQQFMRFLSSPAARSLLSAAGIQ